MCGILGVVGRQPDLNLFRAALDRLTHRGPDGVGVWQDVTSVPIMLGHRRLAIVDTSDAGLQPMTRGALTIVFNGEIYNFPELREELQSLGCRFSTGSDTEVLLAAYDKWGPDCLGKLNGMWAFVIWDADRGELFISRDRFGKKPLFYAFEQGALLFGSEMKALMPLMQQPRISDNFHTLAADIYRYESGAECLVHGIQRFPAACYALISADQTQRQKLPVTQYWNTADQLQAIPASYGQQVERFRELFLDACRIRLRADVPVGVALSGGLDSSAVTVGVAAAGSGASVVQKAFVACFPGSYLDERAFAESVTEKCRIQTQFLDIRPEQGLQRLPEYLFLFEEIYSANPIPMMDIYRSISACGVHVSIDGHGGDELLSGYDGFLLALNDAFPSLSAMRHVLACSNRTAASVIDVLRELRSVNHGNRGVVRALLQQLKNRISGRSAQPLASALNTRLYDEFHRGMLPTLLRNYDRYSMAGSVEIRMPLLDYRLVQFCFSLPWTSRVPQSSQYTKAILRDALQDLLPEKVLHRKDKIGFSSPVGDWLRGPWREWLMDTTSSADFRQCPLIDPQTLIKDRDGLLEHGMSHADAERFWSRLSPFLWEKYFFRRAAAAA